MTKTEAKSTTTPTTTPAASPEDLLKAAVAGKAGPTPEPGMTPEPGAAPAGGLAARLSAIPARARREARLLGVSGGALALGAALGASLTALSSPGRAPGDAVAALSTTLDAGRIETARLGGDIAQLHQVLADLRAATDAARKEAAARGAALTERLAQVDRAVAGRIAALGDRLDQTEREQTARIASLATQLDRRPAAAPVAKAEPTQTGSLADPRGADAKGSEARIADTKAADAKIADTRAADAKGADARTADARASDARTAETRPKAPAPEKPPIIDGWAVRDVYDGTAILENRRRRLVEVAPGDMLPGVGRVDSVERRGREWVVVTRQGLVTPQSW